MSALRLGMLTFVPGSADIASQNPRRIADGALEQGSTVCTENKGADSRHVCWLSGKEDHGIPIYWSSLFPHFFSSPGKICESTDHDRWIELCISAGRSGRGSFKIIVAVPATSIYSFVSLSPNC